MTNEKDDFAHACYAIGVSYLHCYDNITCISLLGDFFLFIKSEMA